MEIDEGLGYPRAYGKLCRNPHFSNPYSQGPPFAYTPYILHSQEDLRARELNQLFPIINPERKLSTNPRNFTNLLWKQLNHLGNAGFDPAVFRVDMHGNVLYYHADPGSPLAWEIDHWFPRSRGGKTVPSNLRLLQWQACRRKKDNLEFLIPWWNLQLGISVNQFLSIFASKNSDFRDRAFRWLFFEGESEDLNDSQAVESHVFPQHFIESKQQVGLAPAAIVSLHRDLDALALQALDLNRSSRSNLPFTARKVSTEDDETQRKAIHRYKPSISKENDNSNMCTNQYLVIARGRDSLRSREETEKTQGEIQKLDDELIGVKQKNDEERLAVQDLESMLIKRRRRVEKCRKLAESQSSYRALLEKMIGDAMHQSVVYKEQIRLNQAANSALMARLEAQKAICDASEKELYKKLQQREEIEDNLRPYADKARKRSRIDDSALEEICSRPSHILLGRDLTKSTRKELRLFLEEEQKASEAEAEEKERENEEKEGKKDIGIEEARVPKNADLALIAAGDEAALDDELQKLALKDGSCKKTDGNEIMNSILQSPETSEDEERRRQVGKDNVDRWLQMLLENAHEEGLFADSPPQNTKKPNKNTVDEQLVGNMNQTNQEKQLQENLTESNFKCGYKEREDQKRNKPSKSSEYEVNKEGCERNKPIWTKSYKTTERKKFSEIGIASKGMGSSSKSYERKERGLARCESARSFRPFPPSPSSMILGMRKGVDCIGKKPLVMDDDEVNVDDGHMINKSSMKTSFKSYTLAIKKVVKK